MGTDPRSPGCARRRTDSRARRRARPQRSTGAVLSVACAVFLSGCASMPDSGDVRRVDSPPEAEAPVRVFGVSPKKDAQPPQIVSGFLEATTSDEIDFTTAREYLTGSAEETWNPFLRTTVLSGTPDVSQYRTSADHADLRDDRYGGYTVEVSGTRIGQVDRNKTYVPGEQPHRASFHLTRTNGEWRIDSLPHGLILGEADFQRIYRSVDRYYYAAYGPEAVGLPGGPDVLVADPIYLRRWIDPVTEIVNALLAGPSGWLDPVVTSAFPRGTGLARSRHLSLDDSGVLKVRLSGKKAVHADPVQCGRMAVQLLHTVQDQASAKVSKVELAGPKGARLCERTSREAESSAPGRLDGDAEQQYFIDGRSRLVALEEDDTAGNPVSGPLGTGARKLSAIAVSRDERLAAGLDGPRRALYGAPLWSGDRLGGPVLTSAKQGNNGLTAPSWDGVGDLWVADRDPDRPRLLRLHGESRQPEEIEVPGLRKGERIKALRVASDGVRIAMVLERPGGRTGLKLGRIERRGGAEHPQVSVEGLRSVAPQLEDVVAASWAGGSRLVVVGRVAGGVQQLQYVETDGSAVHIPPLPGINDVAGVAASEDDSKPMLAETREGIVRLRPDANWRRVAEEGMGPVYPG